jgi:hypothetical protein
LSWSARSVAPAGRAAGAAAAAAARVARAGVVRAGAGAGAVAVAGAGWSARFCADLRAEATCGRAAREARRA